MAGQTVLLVWKTNKTEYIFDKVYIWPFLHTKSFTMSCFFLFCIFLFTGWAELLYHWCCMCVWYFLFFLASRTSSVFLFLLCPPSPSSDVSTSWILCCELGSRNPRVCELYIFKYIPAANNQNFPLIFPTKGCFFFWIWQ